MLHCHGPLDFSHRRLPAWRTTAFRRPFLRTGCMISNRRLAVNGCATRFSSSRKQREATSPTIIHYLQRVEDRYGPITCRTSWFNGRSVRNSGTPLHTICHPNRDLPTLLPLKKPHKIAICLFPLTRQSWQKDALPKNSPLLPIRRFQQSPHCPVVHLLEHHTSKMHTTFLAETLSFATKCRFQENILVQKYTSRSCHEICSSFQSSRSLQPYPRSRG